MLEKLEKYEQLLLIRQKAWRRDAAIAGGLFLLSLLATIALGLLFDLNGRGTYLVVMVLIAFGFNFMMIWVKVETVKSSIELLQNLQRAVRESPGQNG